MTIKYQAVWDVDPVLANWLDHLPEETTLHTLETDLEKLTEQWESMKPGFAI